MTARAIQPRQAPLGAAHFDLRLFGLVFGGFGQMPWVALLLPVLGWGGLTGSHGVSPKHLLRESSKLSAVLPRSRVIFGQPSVAPSCPGPGRLDRWLPEWLGGESQECAPLPTCEGGGAGEVAGQVGSGGNAVPLYTTGRGQKSVRQPRLLILNMV